MNRGQQAAAEAKRIDRRHNGFTVPADVHARVIARTATNEDVERVREARARRPKS